MLHVHRAERADGLVEALRGLLAEAPDDPFAAEVVAVPTRGHGAVAHPADLRPARRVARPRGRRVRERRLPVAAPPRRRRGRDRLGHRRRHRSVAARARGVAAAGGRRGAPRRAVARGAVAPPRRSRPRGRPRAPRTAPGDAAPPRRAVRPLRAAPPGDGPRLGGGDRRRRRGRRPGRRGPLAARALAAAARADRRRPTPPRASTRRARGCGREPELLDLPPRLAIFGLTRLPAGHLQVLGAIADGRDVHLFLLHPSPGLWDRIEQAGVPPVVRRDARPHRRAAGQPAAVVLGRRRARDAARARRRGARRAPPPGGAPRRHAARPHPDRRPRGPRAARPAAARQARRAPAAGRRRPQHPGPRLPRARAPGRGPARRDPPPARGRPDARAARRHRHVPGHRDVRLAHPGDVRRRARSTADEDEADTLPDDVRPPDLRVRLADRALRQTNPVLGVVARLIELAGERVTASQVLDLVDREPVRRRFDLDDDDLARIESWVAESGIRWGLDAEHRAPFKLDVLPAGTWSAGLDRVLVGVAMTEERQRLFEGVLPLDDVDSQRHRARRALRGARRPPRRGARRARHGGHDRRVDVGARRRGRHAHRRRAVATPGSARSSTGSSTTSRARRATAPTELTLPEVRALLADRLQGRPTRANFRTGHLTICTLMPMRSVPHRVVCLLGMDEGVFPRKSPRDGDDLMLRAPHVGDRDPRSEDRQLLLDAVLSATDRLVVTYTGNDERTNAAAAARRPVNELLDVVDRTVRTDDGRARDRVLVRHPLQPFDARNFVAGRARRRPHVELRRGHAGGRPCAGGRADSARRRSCPVRSRSGRRRCSSSTTSCGSSSIPRARSCASGWTSASRLQRRGRRRAARRARRAGAVGRRPPDARGACSRARRWTTASRRRSRAARCRPGGSRCRSSPRVRPVANEIASAARELLAGDAQPGSLDVRVELADGRAPERHGRRRARRRAADRDLLAR